MLRIILAIAVSADVSHGFGFFDPPGELVEEPFALADCAGVVGGGAIFDACGVCDGDGTSCEPDEPVEPPTSALEVETPAPALFEQVIDCAGVPDGTAVIDACGTCDGDGTGCDGCDGVPDSGLKEDACGVCGGDDDCLDCAGVPNGTTVVDECDVCGGDGPPCTEELGSTLGPTSIEPPTLDPPTATPSDAPTATPSDAFTATPTDTPSDAPTATPSDAPTATPSDAPTATPSDAPTGTPTGTPTTESDAPTATPSDAPTTESDAPTATPSDAPSATPSDAPSATPSDAPTASSMSTCCIVPKNSLSAHGFWYQYSMIAFSSDNDAISSQAKNVYCNVATPGGYDHGGYDQQISVNINDCADGESSIDGPTSDKIRFGPINAAPGDFSDTGFDQQTFVDYANHLVEHTYTNAQQWAVKIFPGEDKATATNADCDAPDNAQFTESNNPVKCLLVFPDMTGVITIYRSKSNPSKPSFAILAPLAHVKAGNNINQVGGVIVANKIWVKDATNANDVQLHGYPMVGGDNLACDCS